MIEWRKKIVRIHMLCKKMMNIFRMQSIPSKIINSCNGEEKNMSSGTKTAYIWSVLFFTQLLLLFFCCCEHYFSMNFTKSNILWNLCLFSLSLAFPTGHSCVLWKHSVYVVSFRPWYRIFFAIALWVEMDEWDRKTEKKEVEKRVV